MRSKARFLITIYLVSLAAPVSKRSYADFHSCIKRHLVKEYFGGTKVQLWEVEGLHKKEGDTGGEINVHDVLGRRDQVIFGLSTHTHAYLYADGARHHGMISYFSFEGPRVIKKSTNLVKDGLLLVFSDLTPEQVQAMRNHLVSESDKTRLTFSCVTSACRELKKATGIKPGGGRFIAFNRPSTLVRRILESGFVDAKGDPVKIEVYRTTAKPLDDFHYNFDQLEKIEFLYITVVFTGTGIITLLIVQKIIEQSTPSPTPSPSPLPAVETP